MGGKKRRIGTNFQDEEGTAAPSRDRLSSALSREIATIEITSGAEGGRRDSDEFSFMLKEPPSTPTTIRAETSHFASHPPCLPPPFYFSRLILARTPLPRLTSIISTSPFVPPFPSFRLVRRELFLIFNSSSSSCFLACFCSRSTYRHFSPPSPPSMVGINVGGVALTVSCHVLFFVSRGGKIWKRRRVYRGIPPHSINRSLNNPCHLSRFCMQRVSRNIHGTYSSIPFPPQSAQFPLSSFLFFPPPRPTDPLGCQVFLVQQAIVEATLSAECRP